jgi:hypothetical protein
MRLNGKELEFVDLKEFQKFVLDNDLWGVVQLEAPLIDKSGNILIKEHVNIKESAIKKLETLEGQYQPKFQIRMNNELLEKLKAKLGKEISPKIEKAKFNFISYLFDQNSASVMNYKAFIENAFYKPEIVAYMYSILVTNNEFFDYIVENALLVLAIILQKNYTIRYLNRNAFLAGLFADIALSETNYWKFPFATESDLNISAKVSASICLRFHLPEEVSIPIQNQTIPGIFSEGDIRPIDLEVLTKHPILNSNMPLISEEEGSENKEESIRLITESLKISRFLIELNKKIDTKEDLSEKLVMMLTYNTEKGFFAPEVAYPVIDRFKEYERVVKRIRKIAEMEKKCKYPNSAWAYPKPNATQILCKNKVYECPYFLSGWDINIIATQTAYGYIGISLTPGSYPKCKLEKELQNVVKEFEKE